jgi:hypothetical protein
MSLLIMSLATLSSTGDVVCAVIPIWQRGIASRVVRSCLQPASIRQDRMSALGNSSTPSEAGKATPADSLIKASSPSQMGTAAAAASTAGAEKCLPSPCSLHGPVSPFFPFSGRPCECLHSSPYLQFPCRKTYTLFRARSFSGPSDALCS